MTPATSTTILGTNAGNERHIQQKLQHFSASPFGMTDTHHDASPPSATFIHCLPPEVVAHIFGRLDPTSLTVAASTCRYWRHIVTDDVCWKNAFVAYFGRPPYKRIQPSSWKAEYILRTRLIRKWEKGRATQLTFDPRIGYIDTICVDFQEDLMMAASEEQGVAAQCHPSTGKVHRHLVYSSNEGMPRAVSALKMDNNRILWGFSNGYVTMTVRAKALGRRQLRLFPDFHQGAVRALCLPSFASNIVLSAGDDGRVKILDISTGFTLVGLYGQPSSPTYLEATSDHHVIAGYANGTIVIWNIQLYRLHQQQRYGQDYEKHEEYDGTRRLIQPPTIDNETSVRNMVYDATTETILVAYTDVRNLYQYDIHGGKLLAVMEGQTLGPICAMTWDIEPSFSFTDEPMLDSPSPTTTPQKNRPAQRLVATGDTSGTICLWPLDAYGNDGTTVVRPLCEFHGHASPISAIYLDAFKMVSGADDGRIRIWNPLTGELLRTLGFKISRPTAIYRNDVSSMRVKALSCDEHRCVATIGCQVKSWDFSSVSSSSLSSTSVGKLRQKPKIPPLRDELHYQIKEQVKSSAKILDKERREQALAAKEHDEWTLGGLSNEEMLAYAMMLSHESTVDPMAGTTPDLSQALTASPTFSKQRGVPILDSLLPSSSMDRTHDDTTTTSLMDSDLDWPAIGSKMDNTAFADADEELQYVLRLSRHDT